MEYRLCASPDPSVKEGCVTLFPGGDCKPPEGRYRVVGDFSRYDPPLGIVFIECDNFQRFED